MNFRISLSGLGLKMIDGDSLTLLKRKSVFLQAIVVLELTVILVELGRILLF